MTDDLHAVTELHQVVERHTTLAAEATHKRNAAICAAHRAGVSAHRISLATGLTASRVHAIIKRDG